MMGSFKKPNAGGPPLVKGQIAGITPGGVKAAIAGVTPLANPIVGGVKIPMQGLMEKSKSNPTVKAPLVDGRALINKGISRGLLKAKGGTVKMAKGGTASSRADGIAQRGKTRGRMV